MFGIECSGFLEWLSGRIDCCKPVVKFYPQCKLLDATSPHTTCRRRWVRSSRLKPEPGPPPAAMRENLQRHLIRGTIYVLIGTAGLIGNNYADGKLLVEFFGTLVFGVFFLLAECVSEEVDKPMNPQKYDELEKRSQAAATVALP
jgi:hypothetical protein